MKRILSKLITIVISALCSVLYCHAQNVTNADFHQDGNMVYITYDIDKSANVEVMISFDGGLTFSQPLKSVSGDVGRSVTAGERKRIVWDVLSDYDQVVGENIVFKIKARDKGVSQSYTVNGVNVEVIKVNGVTFEMVEVEGGTFTMGGTSEQGSKADSDEKPTHQVTLSSFFIGKYEVTEKLWRAVLGSYWGDDLPAHYVSGWDGCQEFITKLNQLTGMKFALPTEAQWEYAARGGNKSKGYKYSGSNTIGDVAWYDNNGRKTAHPVGTKSPNELGIYDMSGNVYEMCSDWYGAYSSTSQTNPTGPSSGRYHVIRGGDFVRDARSCRVSSRNSYHYMYAMGIRLVLLP